MKSHKPKQFPSKKKSPNKKGYRCQQLSDYVSGHGDITRLAAAMEPPVSVSQMSHWVAGRQEIPAERCLQITRATGGYVQCSMLRPDINWSTD